MKVIKMRTDHVALYLIHLIVVFSTGSSDNLLLGENNLEYNCSKQRLSLDFPVETIGVNSISSPFITCLSLEGNQIQSVENGAFDGLPSLEYLNMAGNMITDLVAFGGHENLRTLILANQTYFGYDNENTLQIHGKYQELRYLDLSNNKISSIDSTTSVSERLYTPYTPYGQSFQIPMQRTLVISGNIFPKLKYLDLSHNEIRKFVYNDEYSVFNQNLTHLFLHNNNLNDVDIRLFQKLIVLAADQNDIHSLQRNYCNPPCMCVTDMPNLKYLSISNNKRLQIEHDFFEFMPKLVTLNISGNTLDDNVTGLFDRLTCLEDLNIDNNQLTNISIFKKSVNLFSLSVNQNKIRHIATTDLISTPNLRKLYLNHNDISNIHRDAFGSLKLLEELHLANNKLSILPANWSNNMRSLRYLNLDNNKFMSLESLFLSDKLPLMNIYLRNNYLTSLNTYMLRDFPKNVTIHLIHEQPNIAFDFAKKSDQNDYYVSSTEESSLLLYD